LKETSGFRARPQDADAHALHARQGKGIMHGIDRPARNIEAMQAI
jgi:hypothetical protein